MGSYCTWALEQSVTILAFQLWWLMFSHMQLQTPSITKSAKAVLALKLVVCRVLDVCVFIQCMLSLELLVTEGAGYQCSLMLHPHVVPKSLCRQETLLTLVTVLVRIFALLPLVHPTVVQIVGPGHLLAALLAHMLGCCPLLMLPLFFEEPISHTFSVVGLNVSHWHTLIFTVITLGELFPVFHLFIMIDQLLCKAEHCWTLPAFELAPKMHLFSVLANAAPTEALITILTLDNFSSLSFLLST